MTVRRAMPHDAAPMSFGVRLALVLGVSAAAGLGLGAVLRTGKASAPADEPDPVAVATRAVVAPPRADPIRAPIATSADDIDLATRIAKHLPSYPGSKAAALGDDLSTGGSPVPTLFFETRDSVDDVLSFYARSIDATGKIPVYEKLGDGSGWVSVDEPSEGLLYTATAVAQEGRTVVFLTLASADRLLASMRDVPPELPHPAQAVETVSVRVPGRNDEWSIAARVPGQTVREVSEFYRASFSNRGWSVGAIARPEPSQASLEARKGRRVAQVALRQVAPGSGRSPVAAIEIVARVADAEEAAAGQEGPP